MNVRLMIITIDGPAGTGKTTIAKLLAKTLHFAHLDTGAMYRAVTYSVLQNNISLHDQQAMQKLLAHFEFVMKKEGDTLLYFLNGEDVSSEIRSQEVTDFVSEMAQLPQVRSAMVCIQRRFARGINTVGEGRDLGSIVFPDATLKFFLTARIEVCAQRRYKELKEKQGSSCNLTESAVCESLAQRNQLDSNRKISPLVQPKDAIVIDTSDMTIQQVLDCMLAHYHQCCSSSHA